MSKIGAYQPFEKYRNYSLPTAKPLSSHAVYTEKVWTLQEQIYQKLKKIAKLLNNLYPKLTDDFSTNIKVVIEKNLETLIEDLDLLQNSLYSDSFNTNQLKTTQHRITEMKDVCDTLQSVRSYEYEYKNLAKIKHALNELEHLIQPSKFERSLEMASVKSKPKTIRAKKGGTLLKKAKPAKKLPKQKKVVSKQPKKTKTPAHKPKLAAKKATKPKSKLPKQKKIASKLTKKTKTPIHKRKPAAKKTAKLKSKLPAKKVLKAKPKTKIKSTAAHKKKSH